MELFIDMLKNAFSGPKTLSGFLALLLLIIGIETFRISPICPACKPVSMLIAILTIISILLLFLPAESLDPSQPQDMDKKQINLHQIWRFLAINAPAYLFWVLIVGLCSWLCETEPSQCNKTIRDNLTYSLALFCFLTSCFSFGYEFLKAPKR